LSGKDKQIITSKWIYPSNKPVAVPKSLKGQFIWTATCDNWQRR
jgi:hypothetical protein